ncbi:cytochrome P450 [Actinoplanes sp. NPDC051851]|uniref:cytochrome P450 n=1 Tax=Actinoplanes sp. NPDC051851 TaxID=3154753 RepID=UPI00343E4383
MHATSTLDLSDTRLWSRPDLADLIDDLRAEAPVRRTDTAQDGPVWSVLSYELACTVLTDATVYSSTGGSLLGAGAGKCPVGAGRMMALTDPPRHRQLRQPVVPFFSNAAVKRYAERVERLAATAVREALAKGDVDLVDVVSAIPLTVMCDLLDIRDDDRDLVVRVCDQAFLGRTPQERRAGHQQLIPFLFQQVMLRRTSPGDDLISVAATHRVDGRLPPVEDVVLNLDNILVGGVQTVRHTAAMSLWALMNHPDAWAALADGTADLDAATNELLRWTSVGLHMLRTASTSTELGGQTIEAGDRVVVWTWAADHDPAAFDRPRELRLDRSPNRHLALGVGPHHCIGAPLAKAELRAVYRAFLDQVREIELAGEPVHNTSLINFGFDRLPVRLHAR